MTMQMSDDASRSLIEQVRNLQTEINILKTVVPILWTIKTTTGVPATGQSGMFVENTFDGTLHVYHNGAWDLI